MKFLTIPAIFLALALTACAGGKDGSYGIDAPGMKGVVLTLKSNGKAVYMGSAEFNYVVDGKDVKIHMPQGVLVLKGHEDGSLDFPFIGNLKKMPA